MSQLTPEWALIRIKIMLADKQRTYDNLYTQIKSIEGEISGLKEAKDIIEQIQIEEIKS